MKTELLSININRSLAALVKIVNDSQQQNQFRLVSLAGGTVESKPANIAAFETGALPLAKVEMAIIDDANKEEFFASLGTEGYEVISYADVFVDGKSREVVCYRGKKDAKNLWNKGDSHAVCRVAFVDIDSKVPLLEKIALTANSAQDYYYFEPAYIPVPTGGVRTDIDDGQAGPQMFLTRLEPYLVDQPSKLGFDLICCFTRYAIAFQSGDSVCYNYFSATLPGNRVSIISTCDVEDYASDAGISFAKALLFMTLSMVVVTSSSAGLDFHPETVGCLFDFNENRASVVKGFKHMRFDHKKCRDMIDDKRLLHAIDNILSVRL